MALELLQETVELLDTQKEIDNSRAKISDINNTLKAIQLSLMRIEHKESIAPVPKNYTAVATTAAQNSLKNFEGLSTPLLRNNFKHKQATKTDKVLTPKKHIGPKKSWFTLEMRRTRKKSRYY